MIFLKKIDLGANRAITQFFFDTSRYLKFIEMAQKKNIQIPIIPGILPITNFNKTIQFAKSMNCSIPLWLKKCLMD